MRIPGLKRLRASARRLRSRLVDGALILGYHRVDDVSPDPYSLAVSPENFSEQLAFLRKQTYPIGLHTLVESLKTGKIPRRAVVITFDDGYADNLYTAKPLLERYEVPATVFVATGYLGGQFWWDRLDRILPMPAALPEQLSVRLYGTVYRLEAARHRLDESATAWRQRALAWLHRLLLPLSEQERRQVMQEVQAWAGATTHNGRDRKVLSPAEVLRLAQGSLVEIGAHSVSHPILAALPISEQKTEILQSKKYLEELLNQPVTSFSYPHGSLSDATVTAVREAGYACACTSLNDVVWNRSNCFQLPRFWVGNSRGSSFARWLTRWLHD
jgi:peptidoglycan/xylan/chitin deacetylase (PgdA/CDA1 family)